MATRMWRKLKPALFEGFSTAVRATIKKQNIEKDERKSLESLN